MKERGIFVDALQRQTAAERSAFLTEACGGNADLREQVEALLREHEQLGSFLESPPPALAATVAESTVSERPGTVIGPYKLLEQIGEGGFGVVFMAEQMEPIRRKVALKVLKPGMDTRQVIARFEAERQALALMDHPNIARVLDAGTVGQAFQRDAERESQAGKPDLRCGRPYFVMELVRGPSMTDYCDQHNLPVRERLELFVDVCQAVQHAHQKGIIHRDIKPSNVLVTLHDGKPVVKIIDFGIAKAMGQQLTEKTLFTNFAQMIGTPLYMSPEQAEMSGLDVDTRSDIYSLGVLLYELLTGTTPFDKERLKQASFDEIRRIIREEEPPKPSTRMSECSPHAPREDSVTRSVTTTLTSVAAQRQSDSRKLSRLFRGELDWIVMKALEKDRNRRYETASAFAADVGRYLKDEAVLACPPSAWYRWRKFAQRNKRALTTATVVSVAMVLGTVISVWQAVRATDAMNSERATRTDLDEARKRAVEQAAEARQALDRLSEANHHLQRGRYYAGGEQWAKAHEEFSRAVDLRPDNSLVWNERGDLYSNMGLWERAANDYRKAFDLQRPYGALPCLCFSVLFLFVGDNDGYQRLCAEIPKRFDPQAECVGAEDNIVRAYTMISFPGADWAWAVDMGKAGLKRRGRTSWNCHALGRAYFRAGKDHEAVEWLRKSRETEPQLAEGCQNYCVLAMALHRLGQTQEAREALAAGGRVIDGWIQATLTAEGVLTGPPYWVDWPESLLLYREAKTLIDGAPPPQDARLQLIRRKAESLFAAKDEKTHHQDTKDTKKN